MSPLKMSPLQKLRMLGSVRPLRLKPAKPARDRRQSLSLAVKEIFQKRFGVRIQGVLCQRVVARVVLMSHRRVLRVLSRQLTYAGTFVRGTQKRLEIGGAFLRRQLRQRVVGQKRVVVLRQV